MAEKKKSLAETAKLNHTNPSQLGDPISLKAETSNNSPTEHDRPAKKEKESKGQQNRGEQLSLKEKAKRNPTALGDPVSLKAETSDTEPTEHDRGTKGGTGKSKI